MSNKTVSGYTNLLQRMASALSEGRADAEVRYVPVSRTPYVRVTLGDRYAPLDALRRRIELALAQRGFSPAGAHAFERRSDAGWVYLQIEAPTYDPVRAEGFLDLSASGPYNVAQTLDRRQSEPDSERRSFEATRARAERDRETRLLAMRSVAGMLLRAAPFAVPAEHMARLTHDVPAEVVHRIARAFGAQGLASFGDLVESAELGDVLGIAPVAPAP